MKKIAAWIRQRQVLAFFILAYLLSWSILFLYFPLADRDPTGGVFIEPLAVFSPALAAMLIAGLAQPHPKSPRRWPRWVAFGLAWLLSVAVLGLFAWRVYRVTEPLAVVILSGLRAVFPAWAAVAHPRQVWSHRPRLPSA